MLPLRHWSTRRIATLWVATLLLEAGLVVGIRGYTSAVFSREHVALVAEARQSGAAAPDSARDLQVASDSAAGVRFDHRMRRLIAVQQSGVVLMLALVFAAAGASVAWGWLRVRPSGRADVAPPAVPAADAPEHPTS